MVLTQLRLPSYSTSPTITIIRYGGGFSNVQNWFSNIQRPFWATVVTKSSSPTIVIIIHHHHFISWDNMESTYSSSLHTPLVILPHLSPSDHGSLLSLTPSIHQSIQNRCQIITGFEQPGGKAAVYPIPLWADHPSRCVQ